MPPDWAALLWVIAAVTMTVGNVVALAQSNLKRMLAYSSIAHVGYMLVGLVAGGVGGAELGALLSADLHLHDRRRLRGHHALRARAARRSRSADYAGLARRHPVLAATLGLFLLSLVGIPPLAGFVGKFYVFGAAVRAGYFWLAVIGVLNSGGGGVLLPRVIIVYMYMREPEGAATTYASSFAGGLALAIALLAIVLLGVMPAPFVDLAQAAVALPPARTPTLLSTTIAATHERLALTGGWRWWGRVVGAEWAPFVPPHFEEVRRGRTGDGVPTARPHPPPPAPPTTSLGE